MAAAAITAPKSGGQLFLAGKHNFIETVIVDDRDTRHDLAEWMRARGKERREAIWFRDADVAEAIDAVLFVGLADWYPPNYDCGACGYATCAEFLHATKPLRDDSAELEFAGPTCNLRDIDLGIAVGSAAKTAAIHSIDCRCQTRIAVAARKLGIIHADVAVALSLSMTAKAVGFDRKHRRGRRRHPRLPAHRHPPRRRRRRRTLRRGPQPPTTPPADRGDRAAVIDWPQIFYGAALTTAIAARRVRRSCDANAPPSCWCPRWRPRSSDRWRGTPCSTAPPPTPTAFFVDIPFKPFPVSWQDTGSGVFTLATASLFLGLALRRETAGRVLGLALTAAVVAFLVDIYLY